MSQWTFDLGRHQDVLSRLHLESLYEADMLYLNFRLQASAALYFLDVLIYEVNYQWNTEHLGGQWHPKHHHRYHCSRMRREESQGGQQLGSALQPEPDCDLLISEVELPPVSSFILSESVRRGYCHFGDRLSDKTFSLEVSVVCISINLAVMQFSLIHVVFQPA